MPEALLRQWNPARFIIVTVAQRNSLTRLSRSQTRGPVATWLRASCCPGTSSTVGVPRPEPAGSRQAMCSVKRHEQMPRVSQKLHPELEPCVVFVRFRGPTANMRSQRTASWRLLEPGSCASTSGPRSANHSTSTSALCIPRRRRVPQAAACARNDLARVGLLLGSFCLLRMV